MGKTRLLLEWSRNNDGLCTVADQSAASIQRKYFADSVASRFPAFDEVIYPDWQVLLKRMAAEATRVGWPGPLIFDEFPYLAESDRSLPSIFQNWIDHDAAQAGLIVAVAGSSRRMMQGLILDASAALYGRATELLQLKPLLPGYIGSALNLADPIDAVRHYSVWGGTPRYWELAAPHHEDLPSAVDRCVLDPLSPLHDEPDRLLREEIPSALSLRPLLDVIGSAVHRIGEIGARIEQPATSLSRPLARLMELQLVYREVPFGAPEKTSKRTLYRISDPFFRFWFKVVAPSRSLLADAPRETRLMLWEKYEQHLFSETWEELCRRCVAHLHPGTSLAAAGPWHPARCYWRGKGPEWDVVSLSLDRRKLLLGEVKWHSAEATDRVVRDAYRGLLRKGLPDVHGVDDMKVVYALFMPRYPAKKAHSDVHFIDAEDVLASLL